MELRPPAGDESKMPLVRSIAAEIADQGPITFARFMELAIGDPEHGYYTASTDRVGRSGDFLTAPETHPMFGWLLASQLIECWSYLGAPGTFTVAEDGAGRGTLARQIVQRIVAERPDGLRRIEYLLDDVNPVHKADLPTADHRGTGGPQISFEAGSGRTIAGVVIANELVDALPFHRLRSVDGELRELYVDVQDGWLSESVGAITGPASTVTAADLELIEGQTVEVSPAIGNWIRKTAGRLERGFLILIDYGYERPAIHDYDRFPNGTLKTYRGHQVGEDPFRHIGNQDITAHVDFTSVVGQAEAAGLSLEGLTSLAEFVAGLGIDQMLMELQEMMDADDYASARSAAMALLDPGGLGRFKVAVFSTRVDVGEPLKGLSFQMPGLFG